MNVIVYVMQYINIDRF